MVSNLIDFCQQLFGTYQPYNVIDSSGQIVGTCVDFGYFVPIVLFVVVLVFVLKTVGGLIYRAGK